MERTEQRDFLQGIGCEEAQGWLFGRPVPASALRAGWQQRRRRAECAGPAMPTAALPCPAAQFPTAARPAP
ncbi:hypothetical protein GCM10011504_19560 [Siccirubricoccus deserti]|uniref:EAL domain-containing protein n=1 Tax=Siccirubricoccus deserti TaxID=2013562 RepID=A0A9X0QWU1_9PROT|nr:hypothetical protein [Siccirubricoccus deserti]MBC4015381.1 hypothetical protein [Siccirubricoccus deserti]GGC41199.1 hypothetical protein GCM10011504_19560 [Siccirubricoccus deserti]